VCDPVPPLQVSVTIFSCWKKKFRTQLIWMVQNCLCVYLSTTTQSRNVERRYNSTFFNVNNKWPFTLGGGRCGTHQSRDWVGHRTGAKSERKTGIHSNFYLFCSKGSIVFEFHRSRPEHSSTHIISGSLMYQPCSWSSLRLAPSHPSPKLLVQSVTSLLRFRTINRVLSFTIVGRQSVTAPLLLIIKH
jgi:hypothetical protein